MNENEKIMGEQIYLRKMTLEDTDLIIKWRNSDEVRPHFIYQKPFTREGHMMWIENMLDSGKGYQFIICRKEDGMPVGSTYLRDIDREHDKIEYGAFIGEAVQKGKGIGTEMAYLTSKFAFEELHIHKVFSKVLAENEASKRSLVKAGFREEGYFKDEVVINGEYRDLTYYSILNPAHV
ncbi:MAG: GNAT family protein [Eubacteriales bacterium]